MRRVFGWLDLAEKLLLVGLAFAVVIWLLIKLEIWADYFKTFFFMTGDYASLVYLIVGLLVPKKVFEHLLKWHVRMTFRG